MARQSLKGQTALITGASRRIGRVTALTLAAEGVNIVIHYNYSLDESRELCEEVKARGAQAWTLRADFDKLEDCQSLIRRAQELAGSIQILVNNASSFPVEKLEDLSFESLRLNLQVNAWTPFVLGRSFAQQARRGKIVNLLDSRLKGYDWSHVGYILAKHVLAVLTRMMALEYAPEITVNGVAPGLILPPPGEDMSYIERMVNTVPLKRHGDPQDIADAILFLAQSSYITGEVIYVDGGRHLKEYTDGPNPH